MYRQSRLMLPAKLKFMRYNLVEFKLAKWKRLCLPNLDSVTGFTGSAMIDHR